MTIRRIELPTPFAVGSVNAYLLDADPLTLVDCGPSTPEAWEALRCGVEAHGHRLEDVRRLLLTHAHPDHAGLAERVRRAAGCEVYAHGADERRLRGAPGEWEAIVTFNLEVCRRAGAPEDSLAALQKGFDELTDYFEPCGSVTPLGEGGVVAFESGVGWEVLATPGHARGSLCFWEPVRRALLSGDTVLPAISSIALLEPAPGSFRTRSLLEYLATLDRLAALDPEGVYPGHGSPLLPARLPQLVARRGVFHRRRAEALLALVEEGVGSPWGLSQRLFPSQDRSFAHLGVSEVVGHLDLLAAEGVAGFSGQEEPWWASPRRTSSCPP